MVVNLVQKALTKITSSSGQLRSSSSSGGSDRQTSAENVQQAEALLGEVLRVQNRQKLSFRVRKYFLLSIELLTIIFVTGLVVDVSQWPECDAPDCPKMKVCYRGLIFWVN